MNVSTVDRRRQNQLFPSIEKTRRFEGQKNLPRKKFEPVHNRENVAMGIHFE